MKKKSVGGSEVLETKLGDVIWHLEWTFCLTEERGGSLWTFQCSNKLPEVMPGILEPGSLNVIMPLFVYLLNNMTRSDFFFKGYPKRNNVWCPPFITDVETLCFHLTFCKDCQRSAPDYYISGAERNLAKNHKYNLWPRVDEGWSLELHRWQVTIYFRSSTARKADPRARGRKTPATGEREASPGSDGGVKAGSGAGVLTAAAILQVKGPESQECIKHYCRSIVTPQIVFSTLFNQNWHMPFQHQVNNGSNKSNCLHDIEVHLIQYRLWPCVRDMWLLWV